MGVDYSCTGHCMGSEEREKESKYIQNPLQTQKVRGLQSMGMQFGQGNERVLRIHMLRKQESLHLHSNPCEKLKQKCE